MNLYTKLLTLLLTVLFCSCEQDYTQDDQLRDIRTSIDNNYLMLDNGSGQTTFNLYVDAAWSSSISYEGVQKDWLQLSKPSGSISTQIALACTTNQGRRRAAKVTFSDGLTKSCTVTVVQAADPDFEDNDLTSAIATGESYLYENEVVDGSLSYITLSYINGDGSTECTISATTSDQSEVDGISVDLSNPYIFGLGDGAFEIPLSGTPNACGAYVVDLKVSSGGLEIYSTTLSIAVRGDLSIDGIEQENCYFYAGGNLQGKADNNSTIIVPYIVVKYSNGDGATGYRATVAYKDPLQNGITTGVNILKTNGNGCVDGTFAPGDGEIRFALGQANVPYDAESFDVSVKVVEWDGTTEGETIYEGETTIEIIDLGIKATYNSTLQLGVAPAVGNGVTISYNTNNKGEYAKYQLAGTTHGLNGTSFAFTTLESGKESSIFVSPKGTPTSLGEASLALNLFIYPEGESSYTSKPRVKFIFDPIVYTISPEALGFDTPKVVGSQLIEGETIADESMYVEIPYNGAEGEAYDVSMSYTSGSEIGLTLGSATGTFDAVSGTIKLYISGTPAASGDAELSIDIKVDGESYATKSADLSVSGAITGEVSFGEIDLVDCYFYAGGNLQGKAEDNQTKIVPYIVLNYSNGDGASEYRATVDYKDFADATIGGATTGVNIKKSGEYLDGTFAYGGGKIEFMLGQANVPYDAESFVVSVKVVEWDGTTAGDTIYEDEVTIEIIDLGIEYSYNNALTVNGALSGDNAVKISYNENCKGEYAKYQLAGTPLGMAGSVISYTNLASGVSSAITVAPKSAPTASGEAKFTLNFFIYPEGEATFRTRPRVKFIAPAVTYVVTE